MSGGLPTNPLTGESSRSSATETLECGNCEPGALRPPVFYCVECSGLMCEECYEMIHVIRMFEHHSDRMKIGDFLMVKRCMGDKPVSGVQLDEDMQNKFCHYSPLDDRIHLTPRLASLVEDPQAQPSLVSFSGPSGAGKSTLIRLLLSVDGVTDEKCMPLSGAPNDPRSTSADLHMYGGGQDSTYPVLYVDSEGLGGAKEPHAFLRMKENVPKSIADHVWVDRSVHIKISYPRILYIFSDVLCFVFSGDRRQQADIVPPLLEWGAKASIGAANQHLPELFLIFNKVGKEAMKGEFQNFEQAFRNLCEKDVSYEALRQFYSKVHVVMIPNLAINALNFYSRVSQLYNEIRLSIKRIRTRRKKLSQLFTRYQLQMYIRLAADVFRQNPYANFDICKAMMAKCPNPLGFEEYICEFRRVVEQAQSETISNSKKYATSLEILSRRIKHSILFWIGRHPHVPFGATPTLPDDLESALKNAQDRIKGEMPCAETLNDLSCETLEAGHAGVHTFTAGTGVLTHSLKPSGSFKTDLNTESAAQLCQLVNLAKSTFRKESHMDAKKIWKSVMDDRRSECKNFPWLRNLISYRSCVICMLALPTEVLSCGHIICDMCARGEAADSPHAQMRLPKPIIRMECPVCLSQVKWYPKSLPPSAGYRILSLDGGGVRGIVELLTLQAIMSYFRDMHVEDLFDMIIGTSTGGIIALALTVHNGDEHPKRLPDVIQLFKELTRKVFSTKQQKNGTKYDWIRYVLHFLKILDSKFKNDELLKLLKEHLGEQILLRSCARGPHVIITSCDVDKQLAAAWFTSYNRSDDLLQNQAHQWKDELHTGRVQNNHLFNAKEVAAATSAAPTLLPIIEAGNRRWADGGLRYNGPPLIAMYEARRMWPERRASALISLGCGRLETAKEEGGGKKTLGILKLFNLLVDIALDAEEKCVRVISELHLGLEYPEDHRIGPGLRLNPTITLPKGETCELDDAKKMDFLVAETEKYLKTKDGKTLVQQAANLLFAALFYLHIEFDMDTQQPKSWHIRSCSALPASIQVAFTRALRALKPIFTIIVKEAARPIVEFSWDKVTWEQGLMDLPFRLAGLPQMGTLTIVVKLHMCLPDTTELPQDWCLPISGMPFKLK